jgi:muramidase (phage lysozyme)
MKTAYLIASAGLLAAGAWVMSRGAAAEADQLEGEGGGILGDAGQVLGELTEEALQGVATMTGGLFNLSRMRLVSVQDVNHPQVRALLAVIRRGEGTAGANGYRTLFGGELFDSFADHPRRAITRTMGGKKLTSTAAGAYQFLASTWDETARIMALPDFSPASQDRAAVGRIAARGALEDAKAGRLSLALSKVAREWASMPGSPYGQPVISEATARAVFAQAGGVINA